MFRRADGRDAYAMSTGLVGLVGLQYIAGLRWALIIGVRHLNIDKFDRDTRASQCVWTVAVVEPSGFATAWGGPSAKHATPLPAYDTIRAGLDSWRKSFVPGDPEATGPAILKVVGAADPPLRILFGSVGLPMMRAEYAKRIETWEKWNPVSTRSPG